MYICICICICDLYRTSRYDLNWRQVDILIPNLAAVQNTAAKGDMIYQVTTSSLWYVCMYVCRYNLLGNYFKPLVRVYVCM